MYLWVAVGAAGGTVVANSSPTVVFNGGSDDKESMILLTTLQANDWFGEIALVSSILRMLHYVAPMFSV
jgi:hypothetical protein